MAGYSKEAERQNKALKDLMTTGKTEKDYVQVGYEGKQENLGGKTRESELSKVMQSVRMPWFCPNCKKAMKKKLDDKFWRMMGHCFDCQVEYENKLRVKGEFDEWAEKKMLENQKSQIFGNTEASLGRARAKAFQMITAAEAGLDFNYIEGETSAEAIAEAKKLVKDSNLSEEAKAELNEKLEEASNEEGMNGFYLGAELGLPIALTTAEGKKRNSSVAAHEVSHATLFAKLLEGNADAVGLANDLASYLIKNHGELAARKLQGVINTYTKEKGFTDAQIAEEIMAAAVELTRRLDLDISKNQTLQGKLMSRWNKLFPNNKEITEIRTGKDVLDAIISFNSSFDKGEMSGLSKDIIEGKVKARQTTESAIKTARANIQYSKGQDISSAADRAKRVLEKVNLLISYFLVFFVYRRFCRTKS